MNAELPREIRDRTPAPHALRVGLRRAEMPRVAELSSFCAYPGARAEGDASWIRIEWGADRLLVLLEEGKGPAHLGFDHALVVESGLAKACFLAAYFIARRCGGVVQVRQRATGLAAGAFAERFLEDEDIEGRWGRVFPPP